MFMSVFKKKDKVKVNLVMQLKIEKIIKLEASFSLTYMEF